MAKKQKPRRIVVDGIAYQWDLRANDDYVFDLRLSIVAISSSPTGVRSALYMSLARSTLVLPSYVRRLILEARGVGWDPFKELPPGFTFRPASGPYEDEPDPKRHAKRGHPTSDTTPDGGRALPKLEEDLLASIRQAGDADDEPRLVYADWLLQRGDLHGEYINLVCTSRQRPLSSTEDERMRTLFDENQWTWLGPIGDMTSRRRWNRGLVEDVLLDRRSRGVVEPAIGDRRWLTVRRIDTRGQFLIASDIVRILAHPVLRHLDALATTLDVLVMLVDADAVPDVSELTVVWWGTNASGSNANANANASANADANERRLPPDTLPRALPMLIDCSQRSPRARPRRLRHLSIAVNNVSRAELLSAIDDPRLILTVQDDLTSLGEWQSELNRQSSPVLKELRLVRGLALMFEPRSFEVILRYDEQTGRYSHLHLRWTEVYDPWGRNQARLAIERLVANDLSMLSAEGPLIMSAKEGDGDDPASILRARQDDEWLRDLRAAANQWNVSLGGVLRPPSQPTPIVSNR